MENNHFNSLGRNPGKYVHLIGKAKGSVYRALD